MNKRLQKLPIARTGYQIQGSLANDVPAFGGADYNAYIGKPNQKVRKTMGAVPREEANLEAEGGETLVGDLDGSTMPSFFNIKGPRHSSGGVPMNLPDDTFIFSDTASMKITDPKILKMFNKSPKKGGYTPAELSKAYDINKYRKIMQDPESDKMEMKTAEMMIKNYVMKLGALAIAQESKKSFPQGIPVIAKPYMEANKITEADLMPEVAKQQQQQEQMQQQMMAQQQQQAPQGEMMPPQEGAPQQMPSGEPIAQPSMEEGMQGAPQISEEDMMAMQQQDPSQMQQAPMAMYGMSMGGYEMPFAAYGMAMGANSSNYMGRTKTINGSGPFLNREMAKEGLIVGGVLGMPLIMDEGGYIDMYQDGGQKRELTAAELEERRKKQTNIRKEKGTQCPPGYVKLADGTCAKGSIAQGEAAKSNLGNAKKGTGKPDPAWRKTICNELSRGVSPEALAAQGHGTVAGIKSQFADCIKQGSEKIATGNEEVDFLQLENEPETPGEIQKCYCTDPETGEEVEVALTDGKCECEEEYQGEDSYGAQQGSGAYFPEWTTQDKLNLAGAMRTRTGIEYPTAMTYQYPEVELAKEEWLSKVQGLQGQAAKNLDAMNRSAGPSTAKQAMNASLQGDVAEGVVNAIASTQARNVGTENQERQINYQGDVAEGQNRQGIMNQYMDKVGATENNYRGELNAKDALKTQMMNQGIKNAADIYNLQTEQYAIDPRTGMQIFKGGKPFDPRQPDQDVIAYAKELEASHLPEDVQELILKQRFSRYGGPVLQRGGMVYGDMVYPFYYYE
jgi:hypothetical protein